MKCFICCLKCILNWISDPQSLLTLNTKGFCQVNTRIRSDLLLKGYLRSGYVDTRIHLFLGVASKSQCFLRSSIRGRRSVFSVLDMTYLKLNICQAKILCLSHLEKEMRSLLICLLIFNLSFTTAPNYHLAYIHSSFVNNLLVSHLTMKTFFIWAKKVNIPLLHPKYLCVNKDWRFKSPLRFTEHTHCAS